MDVETTVKPPVAVSRPRVSRNHTLKPFVLALLLASSVTACRDSKPAATYPLADPPASYPGQAATGADKTGSPGTPATKATVSPSDTVIWDHLGDWSGGGSLQTESFTGETGALRIKWQVKAAPDKPDASFLLTIHSAISGRPLQVAVDQKGSGADTAYVNEDPRVFFAVVDAQDTQWSFTIDEAVGTKPAR